MISNAAYNNSNVKGLIFLAAFGPNDGQSLSDLVDSSKLPNGFLVFDSVHLKSCTGNQTFELRYGTAESRTAADTMDKRQCKRINRHSLV